MSEPIISALVQAPFVLVMAYLVQRFLAYIAVRDKEWQVFLDQADERIIERLDHMTEAIERVSSLMMKHDAQVTAALRVRSDGEHVPRIPDS